MMMDISNEKMFTNVTSFPFQQTLSQLAEWFAFSQKTHKSTTFPYLQTYIP